MKMDFAEKIETKRLVLERPKPVTFELAKEIYKVVDESRETLKVWLPWPEKVLQVEDEFIALYNYMDKRWEDKTGFAYLIRLKSTNEFLGVIDFVEIDEAKKVAEIGYWLGIYATGKGYMTEAVFALEAEAFKNGLHRVVIKNDTLNLKSANVAKNAGYHLDGVMREDRQDVQTGAFVNTNVWSKLASDK